MDFYAIFFFIQDVILHVISWLSFPVFGGFSILEIMFSLTVVYVVFRLLIAPFIGASIEERRPHTDTENMRNSAFREASRAKTESRILSSSGSDRERRGYFK